MTSTETRVSVLEVGQRSMTDHLSKSSIKVIEFDAKYAAGALEIAREIHAHSLYANMPLDEAKVMRQLSAAGGAVVPDRYFRLAVRGDEVLGGFYGAVSKTFFCDELLARDMGWWVKQTARGGAAAVLLLLDFERWARAAGARKCMVGQSGVEDIERTKRLYEHCGFTLTGYNTAKEL